MVGFRLGEQIGDALLLDWFDCITPVEQSLDRRIDLRRQFIEIGHQLARAGLGHERLELHHLGFPTASCS